ncbi:hypothetical protein HYPSUDRAFT_121599, partial [Hypholoma sublateritium FD-334 SS-4]
YYSPNSNRTVEEPCVHTPEENPFVPHPSTTKSGITRNIMLLDVANYINPRWWSQTWGWIAFMPHEPDYQTPPFTPLMQMPRRLRLHYNIPAVRPLYPLGFGYKRSHLHEGVAMRSMRKAREWFSVWSALFSYMIAMAETKENELHDYAHLSKKGWADYLLERGAELTWLESERFLASWHSFLSSRKPLQQRIEQTETSVDKQKRLARERQPPTKSAKVFHWIKVISGDGYVREQVPKKWREDTLGDYSSKQARYDPFFNEWDCCSELGSD